MTTLDNRPNTALLVVDVQNDVVVMAHERDAVVANVDKCAMERGAYARIGLCAHDDEPPDFDIRENGF